MTCRVSAKPWCMYRINFLYDSVLLSELHCSIQNLMCSFISLLQCISKNQANTPWYYYFVESDYFVLFCMQHGDCSGKLEIHLKTYRILNGVLDSNGQCCDGTIATTSLCEPCDPFIVACLLDARDHGHG